MTRIRKLAVLLALIGAGASTSANEYRCKAPGANVYSASACHVETSTTVSAPAIMPAMRYQAIAIEDFMSLIGNLSGITVCLSTQMRGQISFTSTDLAPWPAVIDRLAEQYGLDVTMIDNVVCLSGEIS